MSVSDARQHPLQQNGREPAQPASRPTETATIAIIYCCECKHWDRRFPQANHAQCLRAMKWGSGGSPLMTTDLSTCSQAEPKGTRG